MKVRDEIRKRCWLSSSTSVAAIQPANATAEWPEGSPPRSGVPRPVSAFVPITRIVVRTSATSVSEAGAFESRSRSRRAAVGDLAGEDEVADRYGDGRRDQDRAGSDVLRELGHRVEGGRGDVDGRLDGGVDHLRDQDEGDREEERNQLELVHADARAATKTIAAIAKWIRMFRWVRRTWMIPWKA